MRDAHASPRAVHISGVHCNISASDFKFCMPLRFAKVHHKITPTGKSGSGLRLGELPKILRFPYNISATAEDGDFKFYAQLKFAEDHHEITHRKKGRWPWTRGAPQIRRFPFNIYAMAEASDFKFGR